MKDILPNDRSTTGENTFVRLHVRGVDNNLYTGVGVLLSDKDSVYKVGFNVSTNNNVVIDSLEFKKNEIVEMEQVEEGSMSVFGQSL